MSHTPKKANAYIPFLLTSIGVIAGYTFLNWYFLLKNPTAFISVDQSNYWIPFALPALPLFFVLKWKFKPKGWNYHGIALLTLIGTICICAPTIIAQYYVNTAAGKLTELQNVNGFNEKNLSKYYTLKDRYVDKWYAGVYGKTKSASRTSYDQEIFIACPLLEKGEDTVQAQFKYWLTRRYYRNFTESFSESEKQKKEDAFWDESWADFNKTNVDSFQYVSIQEFNDDHANFESAVKSSSKYAAGQTFFLFEPHPDPFNERNGNKLFWMVLLFILGQALFYYVTPYLIDFNSSEE